MKLFALVLFVVGCGPVSVSEVVTIQTREQPALIAFRDEASAEWKIPAAVDVGTFEIVVTGPYRVVVACENNDTMFASTAITQLARTPADDLLIEHTCRSTPDPFTVRGTLVQLGGVGLGNVFVTSTSANRAFEHTASAGTYDLVMLLGDFRVGLERIAIRRDVAITGDTDLGTIDLLSEGAQALIPVSFTPSNLGPGEVLSSTTLLSTGSSFGVLQNSSSMGQPGWDARLAPEIMLRSADRQTVRLSANEISGGITRSRGVSRDVRLGDPTAVTLPEPLGPVAFEITADRFAATWSTLPDHDVLDLVRSGSSTGLQRTVRHRLTLSRDFVEATGVTSAALELAGVPGFKSEWHHDPARSQTRSFTASRGAAPEEVASSSVSELLAGP